ncbi:MAG: folate family ECF transporter S component [Lachnospiraceae bacterium]|nr:folate family ECF transporter S component [Lachnospiraceae bacterium]
MSEKKKGFRFDTRTLTMLALLTAMEIILSRFLSLSAWNVKIGFSFVPIVIAAMMFGPVGGGAVAAAGDMLGAILFPIGPYFPGFTLTAFLTGAVFGIFLHKKRDLKNVLLAVGINQFILSLFLNTFWISVLYGSPYMPLLATRIFQSVLLAVVQFAVIKALDKVPAMLFRQAVV